MKLNSKKVIAILSAVLVIVAVFLSLNRENEESKDSNTSRVEIDIKEVSTSTPSSTKVVELSDKEKDEIEDASETNEPILTPLGRVIKPYTKPVPPRPDYEASRWSFIDVNFNKVEDWTENDIVEDYEDDADVVEAFFAQARYHETVLGLARKGELDKESISLNLNKFDNSYYCLSKLYKDSEFYEEGVGVASVVDGTFDPYYNTPEKFELKDSYRKASHGLWSSLTLRSYSPDSCRNYFENSINWEIN